MADRVAVGRVVAFYDSNGVLKPAIITAVRDLAAEKVQLAALDGATWSSVDNVLRKDAPTPTSWNFLDSPRYG